ncbi:MAG: FAD-binding oxidoreductase [Tissierellales bacterium]|nr:FAD-binding oxidoreductase [Tissierellales bacterium]MBN2827006.1 FAD-binding oxidoreductase [Tissierellales bacterium]
MQNRLINKMNENFAEYLRDESRVCGNADSISFPKDEESIINIVKDAYNKNILLTIQGARTGLAAGAVPNGGHIINLSKMDKIISMKNVDEEYYLTVQPGLILSNLIEEVENKKICIENFSKESKKAYVKFLADKNKYFFAPDPTEKTATLGGMVACNASGAKSYLYGSTRNHVTGLKIVFIDGDKLSIQRGVYKARGRRLSFFTSENKKIELKLPKYEMPTTKNASGYFIEDNMDLIDLFIGSDGTLGIITEIEIKLKKRPNIIWGVNCFFEKEDIVIEFVQEVKKQMNCIAAIEFFDKNALEILRKQRENSSGFSKLPSVRKEMEASIYLEIHADDEEKAIEALKNIGEIMKELGNSDENTWVGRTDEDKNKLLLFRHAVPESVNMLIDSRRKDNSKITKLGTDMAVKSKDFRYIFNLYKKDLMKYNLEYAIWGHIGDNHLHVNILPRDINDFEIGKILYKNWADKVSEIGGAVSAEHGIGKIKTEFLKIMYGEEHINEMVKLKKYFDSKELLSIGNMFKIEKGSKY